MCANWTKVIHKSAFSCGMFRGNSTFQMSNRWCLGQWEETFNNKTKLVQLILDRSKLLNFHNKPEYLKIVRATTELCHNLHMARLYKLNG